MRRADETGRTEDQEIADLAFAAMSWAASQGLSGEGAATSEQAWRESRDSTPEVTSQASPKGPAKASAKAASRA